MSLSYTASDIKILTPQEASDRFEFAYVLKLMELYPMRSEQNIKNGVASCIRMGIDPRYYEDYYLKGDPTVKRIPEIEEIFKEIQDEQKLK